VFGGLVLAVPNALQLDATGVQATRQNRDQAIPSAEYSFCPCHLQVPDGLKLDRVKSSGRMPRRVPQLHHMQQVHARLEGTHHTSCCLMKHPIGNMIKQMTFKLKVYDEVNMSPLPNRRKCPSVGQMLQRSFDGAH
jgi:hypothetical protein